MVNEQDPALVAAAVLICLFGSTLALAVVEHRLARKKFLWLRVVVLAACAAGIALWIAHVAAMPADSPAVVGILGASAFLAGIGLGLAYHHRRLAQAMAEANERLKQSEEKYRCSFDFSPQIMWVANATGQSLAISPRWAEIVGEPIDGSFGDSWTRYAHPDDLSRTLEAWSAARTRADTDGTAIDTRVRLRGADGGYRWFRARGRPRRDAQGKVVNWYGTIEDINDQVDAERALRASEELYRLASRATNDVIWDWNIADGQVEWSEAMETVLGYKGAEPGSAREWWEERLHPSDRERFFAQLEELLDSQQDHWNQEFRLRTDSGGYLEMLSRGYVVRDKAGRAVRLIGALMDITARKHSEQELRWAANHDPLTNSPNRTLFAERLEAALDDAAQAGGCVGLLVLDVDRFKTLNDTQGHLAGDALLREIAGRLSRQVPSDATVARLGGDEFAIILPGLPSEDAQQETIEKIFQPMAAPLLYEGRQIEISLSVGAALFPADGTDAEALLKSADLALYAAKAEGVGQIRCFRGEMREAAEREKTMLFESREALSGDRIVPFYQPKVSLRSGRIIGFEALLRWHHHRRGLQAPAELAAAFEDGQLAVQLTDRMLDRIISDMALWLDRGHEFGRIAFNGSTEDFRRGDFAERILGKLARSGIPASRLELEVTETVFLGKQSNEVERTLRVLREAGVTIALDDFGTGYASLTHLKQFPVDTIKIDRSFVSRLISSEQDDAIIVGALIDLAKNLGIATVAEGVETGLQAYLLRTRGCDAGQGYFFERAIPASRLPGFIDAWHAAPDSWSLEGGEVREMRRGAGFPI